MTQGPSTPPLTFSLYHLQWMSVPTHYPLSPQPCLRQFYHDPSSWDWHMVAPYWPSVMCPAIDTQSYYCLLGALKAAAVNTSPCSINLLVVACVCGKTRMHTNTISACNYSNVQIYILRWLGKRKLFFFIFRVILMIHCSVSNSVVVLSP